MLNKLRVIVPLTAVICFAWLAYMSFLVESEGYGNLLLAAPKNESAGGAEIKEIEKVNTEKFMLTYEVSSQKNIYPMLSESKASSQSAVIKGTNFVYPFVMNFNMISGGFFTASAQEQQSKNAVLNELAAFEFFGSTNVAGNRIELDSAVYTVVGVINDRDDENKNVYIPITLLSDKPNVIMTKTDNEAVTEEYVKSELGKVGLSSSAYTYYNLNQSGKVVLDRTLLAVAAVGGAILFFIFRASFRGLKRNINLLKPVYKYNSFFRLFIVSPLGIFKTFFSGVFMTASTGAFVWILSYSAEKILSWNIYIVDVRLYEMTPFAERLSILQDYSNLTNIAFISFIALLAFSVVLLADSGDA